MLQRDRRGEENPGLYLQSALGGPLELVQQVLDVQTQFEAVSSDLRYVYFAANDRKPDAYAVYRWDIAKKEKQLVFDQPEGLWHVSGLRDNGRDDRRLLLRKETGALTAEYWEWDPERKALSPALGQNEKEEYGAREGELIVSANKLGEYRRLYD